MKLNLLLFTFMCSTYAFGQLHQNISTKTSNAKDTIRTYKIPDLDIEMIFIQGGSFMMGENTLEERGPAHEVTVNSYYISRCEITQAQWKSVMGYNESKFSGCDKCPVERISWNDAQDFLKKLSKLTGFSYRLPTEAEWEYAAKGGRKSSNNKYSGSKVAGDVAWYMGNGGQKTHPVGTKQPNELGLYDMSGNVYEWCNDWYDKHNYSHSTANNPKGPASGAQKVVRGGYYGSTMNVIEISDRSISGQEVDYRDNLTGFRIVRNFP